MKQILIKTLAISLLLAMSWAWGYQKGKDNQVIKYQEKIIYKDKENDDKVKEIKKDVYSTAVADLREWLHKHYLLKE